MALIGETPNGTDVPHDQLMAIDLRWLDAATDARAAAPPGLPGARADRDFA